MDMVYYNSVLTAITANGTDAIVGTRKLSQVTQQATFDLLLTASLPAPASDR